MVKRGVIWLAAFAMLAILVMGTTIAGASGITISADSCVLHASDPPYAVVEVQGKVSQDAQGLAGIQVALAIIGPNGQFLAADQVNTGADGRYSAILSLAVAGTGVPAGTATVKAAAAGQTALCQVTIPTLPAAYYGNVKDAGGNPVASGKVQAYIGSKKSGEIDFSNGFFGVKDRNGIKLLVSGSEENRGLPVTFKVTVGGQDFTAKSVPSTVSWLPGDVRQVDLFTGQASKPAVDTTSASNITTGSATLNGSIVSNGGAALTGYGFECSADGNTWTKVQVGTSDKTGSFSHNLTNLSSNKTYSFKAYATNSIGTGYGEVKTFTTSGGGGGGSPADTTPPTIAGTDPANNDINVSTEKTITVTFSESVQADSKYDQIALREVLSGNAAAFTKNINGKVLAIYPTGTLKYSTVYAVYIPAGSIKDLSGNTLANPYTFTFTTQETKPPVPTPTCNFTDMDGHWAKDTVLELCDQGIIAGYEDGAFKPDKKITRLEAALILVRALKISSGTEQDLRKFKDAESIPVWARTDAAAAARAGLIRGYPHADGSLTFEPSKLISRTEEAALLSRVLEDKIGPITPVSLTFTDSDMIPDWARRAVGAALAKNVVGGYPDNTFRPQNHITRAETASMIHRLLNQIEK